MFRSKLCKLDVEKVEWLLNSLIINQSCRVKMKTTQNFEARRMQKFSWQTGKKNSTVLYFGLEFSLHCTIKCRQFLRYNLLQLNNDQEIKNNIQSLKRLNGRMESSEYKPRRIAAKNESYKAVGTRKSGKIRTIW